MSDDPATVSDEHTRYAKVAAGAPMPAPGDVVKVHGITGKVKHVYLVPSDPIYDAVLGLGPGDRMVLVALA